MVSASKAKGGSGIAGMAVAKGVEADAAEGAEPEAGGRIDQAGETRLASMESLRALAAVAVLVSHVFGFAYLWGPAIYGGFLHRVLLGGGFAVFLFFALSGYLLYLPFARRDFGAGTSIRLSRYLGNRAVRILPLYYAVLIVVLLTTQHGGTFDQWWRFAVFGESFSRHTVGTVDGPMWSLVVELHFYILLPVLAAAIRLLARRSYLRAALMLAVLAGASLGLRIALVVHPAHHDLRWEYSLPTTFLFFVSGLALALVRVRWEAGPPGWLAGPLQNGNTWLLASLPLWLLTFWRYDLDAVAALASFLVVGSAALPLRRGRLVRGLDWRPLAVLGTASYSLYLWHMPIVQEVAGARWSPTGFLPLLAILLPLCIAVALVSYIAIESPFLRLRRSWSGRRHPSPAPAVTAAVGATVT
jgi:peptidoglycan/LPS O-acetylase OafA/YrhL